VSAPEPRPRAASLTSNLVAKGFVHAVFAYDVGLSIDLARCRQHVTDLTEVTRIKHKGHAPQYFQFDPPPLRIVQEIPPIELEGRRTLPTVDVSVYDFGGVSVRYAFPFDGPLEDWIGFSCALSATAAVREDSRARVEHLLAVIEAAVDRPNIAGMTEDYLIFQFEGVDRLESLWTERAGQVARLLRSEKDPLSEQEIADAMSARVSFGDADVALVDWNAALQVDREPDDVQAVLEFANLQLLEMRFLDTALDQALDRSYEVIQAERGWIRRGKRARDDLAKVGRFQVDGAILFERVGNALKLLGDQYLARVYRAASQRFRLAEWNAGILRKLETIESIYQKVHDRSSGIRMEALEWIVIALITIEVLLSFLPGLRR
jgi:hypothetical protein